MIISFFKIPSSKHEHISTFSNNDERNKTVGNLETEKTWGDIWCGRHENNKGDDGLKWIEKDPHKSYIHIEKILTNERK